jgi:two-component system, OmpR family, sensor kinase
MSIRLRLSLLYSTILAVASILFGIVLYTTQSTYTMDWLKQDLIVSSNTLGKSVLSTYLDRRPPRSNNLNSTNSNPANSNPANLYSVSATPSESNPFSLNSSGSLRPTPAGPNMDNSNLLGSTPAGPNQGDPNQGGLNQGGLNPADSTLGTPPEAPQPPMSFQSFSSDESFQKMSESEIVRVLSPTGNLVASPLGNPGDILPFSAAGLQSVRNKEDWWEVSEDTDKPLLIYSHPIVFENRVVSILQIARSLSERSQSLEMLRNTLIIATLLTTLIAFLTGWFMAGFALEPIQRIIQTAKKIGNESDFTQRVIYSGPQDEVGQLASTFNVMLSQLQEAYQKVAHSLEMQRNFVADVSHELRTPLTTLRGNLGLLARIPSIPKEDQTDIINDMVDENDRLIRLVNDLLVLARADAGRNLTKEVVAVYPIVEETCRQAAHLAPQRQINFDIDPKINIIGDRDAIKQVLLILLDNAVKHSQGNVIINARVEDPQVVIKVEDNGIGISPEKLKHVFDRFYRSSEDIPGKGFGLGLPIAKALVEGQGGSITMSSEPGKGSSISLRFSLARMPGKL